MRIALRDLQDLVVRVFTGHQVDPEIADVVAAALLRIIRSVGCCLLIGRGITGGRGRRRHGLAIVGLWFDRIRTAIIKKNDSQRHNGYGGPDTDQDVCQQPHANLPFHWLKPV